MNSGNKQNYMLSFEAQFKDRLQAYLESHQLYAKEAMSDFFQMDFNRQLSMVSKLGDICYLSNPYFPIEQCINSLYVSLLTNRVLASFLVPYQSLVTECLPPLLKKKIRGTPDLTLVLDLDETLIHSSIFPIAETDIPIYLDDGENTTVLFSLRIVICKYTTLCYRVTKRGFKTF